MLIAIGTNHKYSPIEIRERLYFSKKILKRALINLLSYKEIKAAVILSTCNRVELYADSPDSVSGQEALKKFLSDYHHLSTDIEPYLYTYIGKEAMLHLFNVACGIDSQIIGESQILDQLISGHQQARLVETTDRFLDSVFIAAIQTSVKVRQETKISGGDISIATAVLDLIKTRYGTIKDKKILIIGVGKISELVAGYLKKEQIKAVFIANRTYQRAVELAKYINAQVLGFDRLKEKLNDTDIIIAATSSPHLILKKEDLMDLNRPLLIIDLAVPRDVDPEVRNLRNVSLFCLDDLDFIIERKLNRRRKEIPKALAIIKQDAEDLCLTESLESEPEKVLLP